MIHGRMQIADTRPARASPGPSCTYLIVTDSDKAVNEISRKFLEHLEKASIICPCLSFLQILLKIRWQIYVESEQLCLKKQPSSNCLIHFYKRYDVVPFDQNLKLC